MNKQENNQEDAVFDFEDYREDIADIALETIESKINIEDTVKICDEFAGIASEDLVMQDEYAGTVSTIEDLEMKVSDLEEVTSNLDGEDVSTRVDDLENRIGGVDFEAIEEAASELSSIDLYDMKCHFERIVDVDFDGMETNLEAAEAGIEALQDERLELKEEIEDLKVEIDSLKEKIETMMPVVEYAKKLLAGPQHTLEG